MSVMDDGSRPARRAASAMRDLTAARFSAIVSCGSTRFSRRPFSGMTWPLTEAGGSSIPRIHAGAGRDRAIRSSPASAVLFLDLRQDALGLFGILASRRQLQVFVERLRGVRHVAFVQICHAEPVMGVRQLRVELDGFLERLLR